MSSSYCGKTLSQFPKVLTEVVTDFIVRDMCPINTEDGEGFVNLMQVSEPCCTVPCKKITKGLVDQKFITGQKVNWQNIVIYLLPLICGPLVLAMGILLLLCTTSQKTLK